MVAQCFHVVSHGKISIFTGRYRLQYKLMLLAIAPCKKIEIRNFSFDYATFEVSSGVYKMSSSLTIFGNSVDVYCDMTTDGGGWIVIQRNRRETSVSFNKKDLETSTQNFGMD